MKVLFLLVVAGIIVLVALGAGGPAGGEQSVVALNGSSGALEVKSSHSGRAVVQAHNMAPGEKARGRVMVSVDRAAKMQLRVDDVERRPGLHGRGLGRWLRIAVKRVGRGPGPRHVYRGGVVGFRQRWLGYWEAGARHRYQMKLRLRPSSGPQNRLQGAGTHFRLRWRAFE